MQHQIYDDHLFENETYTGLIVNGREYQACTFKKCDFTDSDFSNNKFLECTFEHCNLSLTKLTRATLNDVQFKHCKIMGLLFYECQDFLFSVNFDGCILDYSSFMGKKMLKTRFVKSSLKESNFTQSNLAGSVFDQCDLSGTVFNGTDLSSVNFTTSFNYSIDPELNNIRKASFSLDGVSGLLDKYGIRIV